MSPPTTLRSSLDDARYFLRQAELALRYSRRIAPGEVDAISTAEAHTRKLRVIVERQVQRLVAA